MIRKEREDNHWKCCAPPGHVLPKTCYKKGIDIRGKYKNGYLDKNGYFKERNAKRYNKITLRACYDKCKGRCQGVK